MQIQNAQCLCGEIQIAASQLPIHTTICHCKMCQRSTGSAYLLEPIFMRESIKTVSGTPKIYTHISDLSNLALNINFCGTCGTKLFQTFERFPEVVGVFGGTFDDPDWYARTKDNARHIFTRSALKGDILPSGFPLYDQHTSDPTTGKKHQPNILTEHTLVE
ncbi:GFA family protein [Maritalea sp.]|uniref:GFA family protein n=1 Tax=Maritalea sp. TaxID=2003361 RepID=UPI003EF46243